MMVTVNEIIGLIKKARERAQQKKFTQAVELIITLKDIDVKKGFSLNEVVILPHPSSKKASVCVLGSGDMALRSKKANAEKVIEPEELDRINTNKREAKKLTKKFDFFIADTSLMSKVGKSLGQYLGPKGKMAAPVVFNSPIENMLKRFGNSVRIRAKAQLNASCKIGDESMKDTDLSENALAVVSTIEKKLPNGDKNVRNIMIKLTMGKPATLTEAKAI